MYAGLTNQRTMSGQGSGTGASHLFQFRSSLGRTLSYKIKYFFAPTLAVVPHVKYAQSPRLRIITLNTVHTLSWANGDWDFLRGFVRRSLRV